MKLNSSGVVVSIIILIIMMLICHTMNFYYPKNRFEDVGKSDKRNNETKPTDYNEIYYTNDTNEKQLCANVNQAEIPCDIVRTCKTEPTPKPTTIPTRGLNSLSNTELSILYKFIYEHSAREILTRTLKDIKPTTTKPNPWDF